jgi:hypothetical protein
MQESFIYVLRDVIAIVRYNTLIAVERPRVQAGEKNISFAVSSATVVFVDIVNFTP